MHNPHLHLLIDDHEISYRRGLTRFIERPHRIQPGPVLTADHPWEQSRVNLWGSVYWDDREDCYRMWYLADDKSRRDRFQNSLCHATSPDGITWTRGVYTHVDHPAGDATSIVYGDRQQPEVRRLGPPTVLIDPLEPDPNRRYKLVAFFTDQAEDRGFIVAFSGDGIHWDPAPNRVHLPRGDRTCVMQDFQRGGFAMTSRRDHAARDGTAGHARRRDIALSRSDDLLDWTPATVIVDADDDDPPATEFYGMPFFNWGNQYIGLLEYYDPINEILNVQLSTSRDGIRWERAVSRQTYFDVGPSDAWDSTWVAFGMSPPQVRDDEMLLWYSGRPMAHRHERLNIGAIGIARAPRDRFAGLRAGPDGGELTTEWIQVGGPSLRLNIGAANGPVSVAVTGRRRQPHPRLRPRRLRRPNLQWRRRPRHLERPRTSNPSSANASASTSNSPTPPSTPTASPRNSPRSPLPFVVSRSAVFGGPCRTTSAH